MALLKKLPNPLRFSLRTLLIAVTAVSLYLGWEWRFVHEQHAVAAMLDHLEQERGERSLQESRYYYAIVRWKLPSEFSGLRRLLGARPYPRRCFDGYFEQAELDRIRHAYPDVIVEAYYGESDDSTT